MSVTQLWPSNLMIRHFIAAAFVLAIQPALLPADDDVETVKPARKKSDLGGLVRSLFGAGDAVNSEDSVQPALPAIESESVVTDSGATHKQAAQIKVAGNRSDQQLRTFCVSNDGKIYGLVGPDRPYGDVSLSAKNNTAEIRVLDADGKELDSWSVPFAAQSIAVSPKGTIVVAGNGKIAKFDSSGTLLVEADAPHLVRILKSPERLQEEAEANLEEAKEQYEAQVKQANEILNPLEEELEKLESKEESERTATEKRRIRTLKSQIKSQEAAHFSNLQHYKQRSQRSIDSVIKELTGRLKIINALAVSDQDVFIASGVTRGYGYAVWRTNHEFEGGKQIVTGLSGCCGQMDIRCCEDGVYVAENSRKRIVHYDRDGKKLTQWGEGDRNGSTGAKFGGCCNPMNLCFGTAGEVLTAESEGYVKRFTKEGSFLGVVGQAKVSGGCKNVAIGISPDGEKVYFYDREKSRIMVLDKQSDDTKPAGTVEKAGS